MDYYYRRIKKRLNLVVRQEAEFLDWISESRLTSGMISWFGLAVHLPIAIFIASGQYLWAAIFLVIFSSLNILANELADLQQKPSPAGAPLGRYFDKIKEVLLYSGAAYALSGGMHPVGAVWAVLACGISLLAVSEPRGSVPAKRMQFKRTESIPTILQKIFEYRLAILIVGLLIGHLLPALVIITVLAAIVATRLLISLTGKP